MVAELALQALQGHFRELGLRCSCNGGRRLWTATAAGSGEPACIFWMCHAASPYGDARIAAVRMKRSE
jgi:hypothetical protein